MIGKLQSKNPASRYSSAREVVEAVDRGGFGAEPMRPRGKRLYAGFAAMAVAMAIVVILARPFFQPRSESIGGEPVPPPTAAAVAPTGLHYAIGGRWQLENGELVQTKPAIHHPLRRLELDGLHARIGGPFQEH